jgi:hypothetical protein
VEREGVEGGEREGFGKVTVDCGFVNEIIQVRVASTCNHRYYTLCDARH